MKQNRLAALAQISDAVFQSERVKFARLKAKETAVEKQLADLYLARFETGMSQQGAAYRAGADVLWQTWVDQRRETLNTELAQIRAAQLIQQDVLQKAFGRSETAATLARQDQTLYKQRLKRREDQIS